MEQFLMQTYTIALPVILTALMGYIVWLLKNQKKDRDANSKGTMLLLRVQLIEYHDRYMAKGDIPSYAYENFMEMYDAYHEILSVKAGVCDQTYDIVGPICESSDIFGKDRRLPLMDEGDLVIVKTAGAYGFSMASNYNCRPLCAEVLVHKNRYALIRRRQTLENMLFLTREPEWL